MNYGGGQGGYPGPRGDYHSVQKWNSMSSFNNMKAVDWNQVTNLIQVVKNFYKECPSVQARTNEEVVKWREENKVRVVGNSPMKPILSFAEAGLPQYLMKIIQRKMRFILCVTSYLLLDGWTDLHETLGVYTTRHGLLHGVLFNFRSEVQTGSGPFYP